MKLLKFFIMFSLALSLCACAMTKPKQPIYLGYSQTQVLEAQGRPNHYSTRITANGEETVWTYTCIGVLPDIKFAIVPCMHLIFVDGALIEAIVVR